MDEREFYTERTETKPAELHCPFCRRAYTYQLRWVVRAKKASLPPRASSEDKARFAKARSYMVRADDAVSFARGLHEAARRDASIPGLRAGIHRGPAIYRAGDYIGTTVNLASRVTGTATAGQTVLTESVAEKLGMHLNSVYRAKDQITRLLQEKVLAMRHED